MSFEIEDGEIFGLLGPNGSGKTTTLECLIGLRQPDAGAIEVCGIDARRRPQAVKQKIGAVLQTTALQDKITPREALRSSPPSTATEPRRQICSSGSRSARRRTRRSTPCRAANDSDSRVALAFVNDPELVFLDEPTTGLDPQSRRELHADIARMKRDGHTVLLTTHYLDEAEQLCDRIAIIDRGRIIASGPPRSLIAESTAMQSVSLTTARPLEPRLVVERAGRRGSGLRATGTVTFRTADRQRARSPRSMRLLDERGVELIELQVRKATLEDVFIALTADGVRH